MQQYRTRCDLCSGMGEIIRGNSALFCFLCMSLFRVSLTSISPPPSSLFPLPSFPSLPSSLFPPPSLPSPPFPMCCRCCTNPSPPLTEEDRCKTCEGAKVIRDRKVLEVCLGPLCEFLVIWERLLRVLLSACCTICCHCGCGCTCYHTV